MDRLRNLSQGETVLEMITEGEKGLVVNRRLLGERRIEPNKTSKCGWH